MCVWMCEVCVCVCVRGGRTLPDLIRLFDLQNTSTIIPSSFYPQSTAAPGEMNQVAGILYVSGLHYGSIDVKGIILICSHLPSE